MSRRADGGRPALAGTTTDVSLRRQTQYGELAVPARNPARPSPAGAGSSSSRPSLASFAGVTSSSAGSSRAAGGGGGGGRARSTSNVGARLLKKRQSISVQHVTPAPRAPGLPSSSSLSQLDELPPDVPAIPVDYTAAAAAAAARSQPTTPPPAAAVPQELDPSAQEFLAVTGFDMDVLASDTFKPEDFLRHEIGGAAKTSAANQMAELRQFRLRVEHAQQVAENDLQRSVFRNYTDFTLISKEIAALENEMLELKGVLEQWRSVPDSLEGTWGDDDLLIGGSNAAARRQHRNSLADLATLYRSQLSALWEGVEGSQKFLPFVPGRHLIAESASFTELNAATYKPTQPVHVFLLNDAMLISVKKRRGDGQMKLVAERCLNLSEIIVVDLKDAAELVNAIKIKRGKETLIFRTDKAEDKKQLLAAFKKVAEDMMNKKRKEMLSEAEARKGDFTSRMSRLLDYDGSSTAAGFNPVEHFGFGKHDPSGKDVGWINDWSDEMTVHIAVRDFDDAVALVEKAKRALPLVAANAHASLLFRSRLDVRSDELVALLLRDLADHSIRKSGVVRLTAWLLRLGQPEKARETLLSGRGSLLKRRARQIKFEGDISMYISELAMVCFTVIKNTCEWYMAAFRDNRMASGFVRWASKQVEVFAEMFRRQVYGSDQDDVVVAESLAVTRTHSSMLREVGLDFTFLLDSLLSPTKAAEGGVGNIGTGETSAQPPRQQQQQQTSAEAEFGRHLRVSADAPGESSRKTASAVAFARHSILVQNQQQLGGAGAAPPAPRLAA